jgi:polyisoprenoid-binding protein YceI
MVTQRDRLPAFARASRRRAARPGPGRLAAPIGIIACTLLAAACTTRPSGPVPLPPKPTPEISTAQPGSGPATGVPAGARSFQIDPGRSSVTILVNRAGPFARFAHNHVVTSGQESGFAWEGRDPAGSGFEVHVPVASLVVDDPAARAAAGGEFAGEVPESAREGTYRNMTRPEVLDVAEYPEVIVRCKSLGGTWEQPVAAADLTIRAVTRRVDIPIELERSRDMLVARGSFSIRQSDFGITPFSVAGGAIQVGDELGLSFEIVAVAR